jgi:hypothetical protein
MNLTGTNLGQDTVCGAYLKRVLFFSVEKPIYFFYYTGE